MKRDKRRGFSLVELTVVVAIISVLSAVAVPGFQSFYLKNRRAEATTGLSTLYVSEHAFRGDAGYFTKSLLQLGYSLGEQPSADNQLCIEGAFVACGRYFSIFVVAASSNTFAVEADGSFQGLGDELLILYP